MYHSPSMLVGGKWRRAIGGRTLPVINPCTEEVLGESRSSRKAIRCRSDTRWSSDGDWSV